MALPEHDRIEAYARFLRSHTKTGCGWLGPGECEEISCIIDEYLKMASTKTEAKD